MLRREDPVVEGCARALYVLSYISFVEDESRAFDKDPPRAGSGEDWYEVVGDTPDRAYELAFCLLTKWELANGRQIQWLVDHVLQYAGRGDEAKEELGRLFALQVLGTGRCWADDYRADKAIKYPLEDSGHIEGDLSEEIEAELATWHGIR